MPRRPKAYTNISPELQIFVYNLAHCERNGHTFTQLGTKSECFDFRRRLYGWRHVVQEALANNDDKISKPCREWLAGLFGPRVTRDWFYLTRFDVLPAGGMWQVRGSVRRPLCGPDIVFEDETTVTPETGADLDFMKDIIANARRGISQ